MLLSETEERGRKFTLALRAGIPILLLIGLVIYNSLFYGQAVELTIYNGLLLAGVIFSTVYFIYFLIEKDYKHTLIDTTTQGFNQKAFMEKLEQHKPKSLVLLIIDNLATLNEHYSIEEVDLLLYTLINNLNITLKQHGLSDILIGRLYGAEFVIALNENSGNIETLLEEYISQNQRINTIEVDYKFSIATNTGEYFEKTIMQLKSIIASERKNSSHQKEKRVISNAQELSEAESSIVTAINSEQLLLFFRPLQRTDNGHIDIYEISIKLLSSSMKHILPRVFLPIVNRLGLGRKYDYILLKHLVDLLPLVDETVSFTFNLSPFSLRDDEFQSKFFHYIEEKGVDPSRLIIQLYERKTHHNLSGYLKTLNSFRAKGIHIAIDNFGSSNASMEYMKHFKFDLVQFDRDYTTKLDDAHTYAMLTSIVTMSKNLGITTVAKWVDDAEQIAKLKALGIDYLQGFGIAKSISKKTLINQLN